ncbi:MAG: hypothetical protein KatS3mg108_3349 [Isosphaeraceae bacterium]|jgi:hypothetical protein|nr:MAG: hypothetical protein KatS3mg108_3349 [Isosphaeraceae bacterium]
MRAVSLRMAAWALGMGLGAEASAQDGELSRVYRAPGFYGTVWGNASYGQARAESDYASPFGVNYGLGIGPYRVLPGPYGRGLWSEALGIATTGDGSGGWLGYRTFAHPPTPGEPLPGIGHYAPVLGPPYAGTERRR